MLDARRSKFQCPYPHPAINAVIITDPCQRQWVLYLSIGSVFVVAGLLFAWFYWKCVMYNASVGRRKFIWFMRWLYYIAQQGWSLSLSLSFFLSPSIPIFLHFFLFSSSPFHFLLGPCCFCKPSASICARPWVLLLFLLYIFISNTITHTIYYYYCYV